MIVFSLSWDHCKKQEGLCFLKCLMKITYPGCKNPFPKVGCFAQPSCRGRGRGPASSWHSRPCRLPRKDLTQSEEWMRDGTRGNGGAMKEGEGGTGVGM